MKEQNEAKNLKKGKRLGSILAAATFFLTIGGHIIASYFNDNNNDNNIDLNKTSISQELKDNLSKECQLSEQYYKTGELFDLKEAMDMDVVKVIDPLRDWEYMPYEAIEEAEDKESIANRTSLYRLVGDKSFDLAAWGSIKEENGKIYASMVDAKNAEVAKKCANANMPFYLRGAMEAGIVTVYGAGLSTPENLSNDNPVLHQYKNHDEVLNDIDNHQIKIYYDHDKYPWYDVEFKIFGQDICLYPTPIFYGKIQDFTTATYEQLPSEYVLQYHDLINQDSEMLKDDEIMRPFTYPNGSVRTVLENGNVSIRDSKGNEMIIETNKYGGLFISAGDGLTVWTGIDNVTTNQDSNEVQIMILPTGEVIRREYYINELDENGKCCSRLVSSNGVEAYFDFDGYLEGAIGKDGDFVHGTSDGRITLYNNNGEEIEICNMPKITDSNVTGAQFGRGLTIRTFENEELKSICVIDGANNCSYYGEIEYVGENEYKCTWSSNIVMYFKKIQCESSLDNTLEVVTFIEYPNGCSVEITDECVIFTYGEEVIGFVGLATPGDVSLDSEYGINIATPGYGNDYITINPLEIYEERVEVECEIDGQQAKGYVKAL